MKYHAALFALLTGTLAAVESDFIDDPLGWTLIAHQSDTDPTDPQGVIATDDSPVATQDFLIVSPLSDPTGAPAETTWMVAPKDFLGSWRDAYEIEIGMEVRNRDGRTFRPVALFIQGIEGVNSAIFEFDTALTPPNTVEIALTAPVEETAWQVKGDWDQIIGNVGLFYIRMDLTSSSDDPEEVGVDYVNRVDVVTHGPNVINPEVLSAVSVEVFAGEDAEVFLEGSSNLQDWDVIESFFTSSLPESREYCFGTSSSDGPGYFRASANSFSNGGGRTEFETISTPIDFEVVGMEGRTTILRASLDSLDVGRYERLVLRDRDLGLGAAGVFTGFDLDFIYLDGDGDVLTTDDQMTGGFGEGEWLFPGTLRSDPDFPFPATPSRPGSHFGLTDEEFLDQDLATLNELDAAYDLPLDVDNSSGFLSLGDGGELSWSLPFFQTNTADPYHILIGEVGMTDGENVSGALEYEEIIFIPDPVELDVNIYPAVELIFEAPPNETLQPQYSTDGEVWIDLGASIFTGPGEGNTFLSRCFSLKEISGRKFRILIEDNGN